MFRILDLYCGAGGASMGLHQAGFEVVGVDIKPQPNYPFEFHQADALSYPLDGFDAYWASPPCQKYSVMRRGRWQDRDHPDLIAPTRNRILETGKPYILENVTGAKRELITPILLCGTMFGLETEQGSQLRRHRYFEAPDLPILTRSCRHNNGSAIGVYGGGQHPLRRVPATVGVWGHAGGSSNRDGLIQFGTATRREVMGIDWMSGNELSEAIPPAYSEYLGKQLIKILESK